MKCTIGTSEIASSCPSPLIVRGFDTTANLDNNLVSTARLLSGGNPSIGLFCVFRYPGVTASMSEEF